MKILHIVHWFPSQRNPHSGLFVHDYIDAIHQRNPQDALVIFLDIFRTQKLLPEIQVKKEISDAKIEIIHIEFGWFLWGLIYTYPQIQWLFFKKLLKQVTANFNPDIIHAHVVHPAGAIGFNLSLSKGKPLVITEHWSNTPSYYKKRISSYLGKKAYRGASYILPVSDFLRTRLLTLDAKLKPDRVIRVPNVVNEDIFNYTEKAKSADQVIRFMAVSSWNRYKQITKRPDLIIESLAEFSKETGIKVHLAIVGDGDMIPEMHRLVEQCDLPAVFHGRMNKQGISALLRESDFFMHASNIETFSLVVAEALMTGTPAIVSHEGALAELVSADCGVVCENNIKSWVDGLKILTSTEYNGKSISESIKAICSYDSVSNQLHRLYSSAKKD